MKFSIMPCLICFIFLSSHTNHCMQNNYTPLPVFYIFGNDYKLYPQKIDIGKPEKVTLELQKLPGKISKITHINPDAYDNDLKFAPINSILNSLKKLLKEHKCNQQRCIIAAFGIYADPTLRLIEHEGLNFFKYPITFISASGLHMGEEHIPAFVANPQTDAEKEYVTQLKTKDKMFEYIGYMGYLPEVASSKLSGYFGPSTIFTKRMQNLTSVANYYVPSSCRSTYVPGLFEGYFSDKTDRQLYLEHSLLAKFNNEVRHDYVEMYEHNMTSTMEKFFPIALRHHPFLGPWQTSIFMDSSRLKEPVDTYTHALIAKEFQETEQYKEDLIGLGTMLKTKKLEFTVVTEQENNLSAVLASIIQRTALPDNATYKLTDSMCE